MLFVTLMVYVARLIFLALSYLFRLVTCGRCGDGAISFFSDGLFWNFPLQLAIEGYFEFVISGYLGV